MPKSKPNVSFVVDNKLCLGCGICQSACPTNAIKIIHQDGLYQPSVDSESCINTKGCSICNDICPGNGVDLKRISEAVIQGDDVRFDSNAGRYLKCYTGYSTDKEIRYHSASGGLVSQFLIYLLEKEIIDGAVVAAFDSSEEYLNKTIVATCKEDIIKSRSSKYGPVSMHNALEILNNQEGKFIVVGLPCHIHGFRKYAEKKSPFKRKILGYFAIYCSSNRSFYLTDYVFNERNINKTDLAYFAYRDLGCLGSMVAEDKQGNKYIEPYQSYFHPLRSFFIPRRCISCIDHYGELSDISFGDIHYGKYKDDKVGTSSLIVRNHYFHRLLKEMQQDSKVVLEDLDILILNRSQRMLKQKKKRAATIMKMDKLRGRIPPKYDVDLSDDSKIKSVVSYFHTILQIYIGSHKRMWFFIKYFKKKKAINS